MSRHVWIGSEAMILSGSDIGSSSIVGARSIIDANYPNNCIVAGSPARIIKKDITWARQPFYTDMYQDKCIETLMNPTKFV